MGCVLIDENEEPVALGVVCPFQWSGEIEDLPTFNELVKISQQFQSKQKRFNSLVALSASVIPNRQGRGRFCLDYYDDRKVDGETGRTKDMIH